MHYDTMYKLIYTTIE